MERNRPPVGQQLADLRVALHCTSDNAPEWLRQAAQAYAVGNDQEAVRILDRQFPALCNAGEATGCLVGLINTLCPEPSFLRVA